MEYVSGSFILLVVAALLLFHAIRRQGWRIAVLALSSVAFISGYAASPLAFAPLLGFVMIGYALVAFARTHPPKALFAISLASLIALFGYLKHYTILAALPAWQVPYVTVGMSYILFRVIHLMVDNYQSTETLLPGPLSFFHYVCSFLTFASGPIVRYEDHRQQEEGLATFRPTRGEVYAACSRIVNGYLKLIILSEIARRKHGILVEEMSAAQVAGGPWLALLFAAAGLVYLLYLYFNFSGSIDLVIGLGGLFGVSLPENFDRPFACTNLLDFWNRWHITLSQWFKFYVFNPIVKAIAVRSRSPSGAIYGGVLAYFITFFAMGVWHGSIPVFIVYGLFLGTGVAVNKLYEIEMGKRLGKKRLGALRANASYRQVARGLAIAYFALALSCFWMTFGQLGALVRSLAGPALLTSVALGTTLVVAAHLVWSLIGLAIPPLGRLFDEMAATLLGRTLWIAGRIVLVVAIAWADSFKAPDLIYRAF